MRTETDDFKQEDGNEDVLHFRACCSALIATVIKPLMTRQQAAEFARQILEMCGEGESEQMD